MAVPGGLVVSTGSEQVLRHTAPLTRQTGHETLIHAVSALGRHHHIVASAHHDTGTKPALLQESCTVASAQHHQAELLSQVA